MRLSLLLLLLEAVEANRLLLSALCLITVTGPSIIDNYVINHYRSHDVCSKQSVGLFVTQNLDEAVCVVVGLGSAVGGEGEFAYRIFDAWKTETPRENSDQNIRKSEFFIACLLI